MRGRQRLGGADFADVMLFFNKTTWIAGNEPVALFDCNANGQSDFADLVWLLNTLKDVARPPFSLEYRDRLLLV